MELIVYYDEKYGTSWIPKEVSFRIRDFLKEKGFKIFDAESLRDKMIKAVDDDTCCNSLIVFSQDVVPEIVSRGWFLNSLFRSYLDLGGTIVWIGDIPFFYEGCNPSRQKELEKQYPKEELDKKWRIQLRSGKIDLNPEMAIDKENKFLKTMGRPGCFCALGVIPVWLEYPHSKVKITKNGAKFGLKTPWYSPRPILIKGTSLRENKPIVLAKSKPRYLVSQEKSILKEEKERRLWTNFFDFFVKILGLVPAIITIISSLAAAYFLVPSFGNTVALPIVGGATVILSANILYWFFWSRSTYASAWFKNFDKRHPFSGFIRFWDFGPWRITEEMLKELYDVIEKRKKIIDNHLNTAKHLVMNISETENLDFVEKDLCPGI
jgi:hypothetical protein